MALGFALANIAFSPNKADIVKPLPKDDDDPDRVYCICSRVRLRTFERPISERVVKRVKMKEALLPRYAPLDVKDVLGKIAVEPVLRGEPVSLYRVVDPDEIDGYYDDGDLVPKGKRRMDLWFHLPGHSARGESWGYPTELLAGCYVDVVAQLEDKAKVVAAKALLYRAGGKWGLGKPPLSGELLLTEEQAKTIELLQQGKAKLKLLLRSYKDFN